MVLLSQSSLLYSSYNSAGRTIIISGFEIDRRRIRRSKSDLAVGCVLAQCRQLRLIFSTVSGMKKEVTTQRHTAMVRYGPCRSATMVDDKPVAGNRAVEGKCDQVNAIERDKGAGMGGAQ